MNGDECSSSACGYRAPLTLPFLLCCWASVMWDAAALPYREVLVSYTGESGYQPGKEATGSQGTSRSFSFKEPHQKTEIPWMHRQASACVSLSTTSSKLPYRTHQHSIIGSMWLSPEYIFCLLLKFFPASPNFSKPPQPLEENTAVALRGLREEHNQK